MNKLEKEVLRVCKQFDKTGEDFRDTVGSIFLFMSSRRRMRYDKTKTQ